MARVLAIGDIHAPVEHPQYLNFCLDLWSQWQCDKVVFIGDVVDWHAISFHAHHPEAPGPLDEYSLALQSIQTWAEAFPEASVCIGNHDRRVSRMAESVGIPSQLLRPYSEIWSTPGWQWVDETIIDDIYYFHGEGCGGQYPAFNVVRKMACSVVMGHVHTAGGVKWLVGPRCRLFGMDLGCGIDDTKAAFAYGRKFKLKSVLSAGVVVDGIPYHEIMPCAPGEAYHKAVEA